jgi:hypothetical protein
MGMDRCHEENGPQVDRGRLPVSTSVPHTAPAATQSDTMDTGDMSNVPFEPRRRILGKTPRLL